MTTTPVEQAQSPPTEQDASSDNLIHSEDDITSTDTLPASDPTPDGATSITARTTKDILNNVQKDLINIKSKVSKTV